MTLVAIEKVIEFIIGIQLPISLIALVLMIEEPWLEYRERSRALEWLKITENCQSLHEYSRSSIDRSIVNFESKQRELEKNNEYLEIPANRPKQPKCLISNRYGTMTGYN